MPVLMDAEEIVLNEEEEGGRTQGFGRGWGLREMWSRPRGCPGPTAPAAVGSSRLRGPVPLCARLTWMASTGFGNHQHMSIMARLGLKNPKPQKERTTTPPTALTDSATEQVGLPD